MHLRFNHLACDWLWFKNQGTSGATKNSFLVAHSGRSQAPAPSPSHPWWMKQVIKEEFELRSFSRDFLSRLLNRQPMNGPLLTNTALLHRLSKQSTIVGTGGKGIWMDSAVCRCGESHYQLTLHGLCVWESATSHKPSAFPTCAFTGNNRGTICKMLLLPPPLLPFIEKTILI